MDKLKGRYKVSWEEGGCDWKSYTDNIDEAIKYAYEKEIVSDHVVSILDTKTNKRIFPLDSEKAMKKGSIKKPEIEVAMNLEKLILSIMEREDTDKVTVKLVNGFWEIEPKKREKTNIRGIYVYAKNKNKKR